ncbi:MAG: NBR1-Ig-like domain-containing protein [Anaerolineales bacterium]
MKKYLKAKTLITVSFALVLLLGACRAPAAEPTGDPTQDLNALYTQVAGTLIAQGGQVATAEVTNTPLVVTATESPTPIEPTTAPTHTPAPPTNTAVPVAVCNQAAFISDVTIPDNTKMAKGHDFTKTWRIRNTGTCTWNDDYEVVFSSGTNLAAKATYALPKVVKPGENVDISIAMEAPDKNGTFKSSWEIRSDKDVEFGVGGSGGSAGVPIFVLIQVGSGTASGTVKYDFAEDACDADWSSDTKNNLPCPGTNSGSDGFMMVLQDPDLETRQEDEPAIWMHPNHDGDGYIRGEYPKYAVKDGDHFLAAVGCLNGNPNCRVTLTLSYIRNNGSEHVLGTWDEKTDNLIRSVDVNLSSLAGQTVRFVLIVEPGNNSFNQANAFWFVPRIENK